MISGFRLKVIIILDVDHDCASVSKCILSLLLFLERCSSVSHLVLGHVLTDGFTVNYNPLTIQRSDPIVSPRVGSGHVHIVTGGTTFQRTMSANTAVNAKAKTCDKILDKSNYWIPQLYHIRSNGLFELVRMQGNVSSPRTRCGESSNVMVPGCILYESSL